MKPSQVKNHPNGMACGRLQNMHQFRASFDNNYVIIKEGSKIFLSL